MLRTRARLMVVITTVGCSSPNVDLYGVEELPAPDLRAGDAAVGEQLLLNGGYQTCGIPRTVWDRAGEAVPQGRPLPGREGANAALPFEFSPGVTARGVEVVNTSCFSCHAGTVNDELVVGLGNAFMDTASSKASVVSLAYLLAQTDEERAELDISMPMAELSDAYATGIRGANFGDATLLAFAAHRDPLTLEWLDEPFMETPPAPALPYDVPPWWHMAKKHAMFTNSAVRGDYTAFVMNGALACVETDAQAWELVDRSADVRAFLQSIEPPLWPFAAPADRDVRAGERVFEDHCAACHGTYGEEESYPNLLVPVEQVGTDRAAADQLQLWEDGWTESFAGLPFGDQVDWAPRAGHVPPPLDGLWASAPYLHNGSVPTLAQLLDSSLRPDLWARTEREGVDYDREQVGLSHVVLDDPSEAEAELVYDTLQYGFGNGGHLFGDALSPGDRAALLEYLKTL